MSMTGRGRMGKPSIRALLDHMPDDGCILMFNCYHRNVRSKGMGILQMNVISDEPIRRIDDQTHKVCDLYITFKD